MHYSDATLITRLTARICYNIRASLIIMTACDGSTAYGGHISYNIMPYIMRVVAGRLVFAVTHDMEIDCYIYIQSRRYELPTNAMTFSSYSSFLPMQCVRYTSSPAVTGGSKGISPAISPSGLSMGLDPRSRQKMHGQFIVHITPIYMYVTYYICCHQTCQNGE